jgi:integrase
MGGSWNGLSRSHWPLKTRWGGAGKPEGGWIFPTGSREGHLNKDTAKDQHKIAIERANLKASAEGLKVIQAFQPYVLRHTALTQLANAGCDVFTLPRIPGHSSVTITQRYVHPQANAMERAFSQLEGNRKPSPVESDRNAETRHILGTVQIGKI